MFNKLKQLKDLRDHAKKMQSVLSEENVTVERKGVTIVMNGNMEIVSIKIADDVAKSNLEVILKDNFNDAIKQIQKIMAKKMQEMGGFPGMG